MSTAFENIFSGLSDGSVVPYLGAGALSGVIDPATGKAIPADSDSLIIAMGIKGVSIAFVFAQTLKA